MRKKCKNFLMAVLIRIAICVLMLVAEEFMTVSTLITSIIQLYIRIVLITLIFHVIILNIH